MKSLKETLEFIKNSVVPSFPPYFNIFTLYAVGFHEKFAKIFDSWVRDGLIQPIDVLQTGSDSVSPELTNVQSYGLIKGMLSSSLQLV